MKGEGWWRSVSDPFKVRGGVLSIVASRIPSDLKQVLFGNEYVSGLADDPEIVFPEIRVFRDPRQDTVGAPGVWPAFWLLANDGGWPPEIDAMEGRGQRPGDVVMTTHWRIQPPVFVESRASTFSVPTPGPTSMTTVCYGTRIASSTS